MRRVKLLSFVLALSVAGGAAAVVNLASRPDSALAMTDVSHDDSVQKQQDIQRATQNNGISPDRLIVTYQPAAAALLRDQVHTELGATVLQADAPTRREVLRLPAGNAEKVAQTLSHMPGIASASPDRVMSVGVTISGSDPLDGTAWGVQKIAADQAWTISKGNGVKVAVLDCGIDTAHPDLQGQVVAQQNFSTSASPDDRCNHGTHVAGTIAAHTPNSSDSVAPGASLLNVKVVGDDGHGLVSDLERGVRWATDNGAKVINISLAAPTACLPDIQDAMNYAHDHGVVVVAAAGNAAASQPAAPANCANVVSVGAVDQSGARASFSNAGGGTLLAAPGVNIGSTVNPDLNGGRAYGVGSGTSMAAPHVSGVAALLWATPRIGTSADAVIQRLESTADGGPGTPSLWQYGIVDALKAVTVPAPPTPSPKPTLAPRPQASPTTSPARPAMPTLPPAPVVVAAPPTRTTSAAPTMPPMPTPAPAAPAAAAQGPAAQGSAAQAGAPTDSAASPKVRASIVGGHVQVQWSDAPTPGITHTVSRGDASGQNMQPIATNLPAALGAVVDASAQPGQTYTYQVTANAPAGSPTSGSARVSISVPRA